MIKKGVTLLLSVFVLTVAWGENHYTPKKAFAANGKVENTADRNLSGNMNKEMIALAYSEDLGKVGTDKVAGHVLIGYDDLYSIQYFGKKSDALLEEKRSGNDRTGVCCS